jgi:hypothetical protein
MIIVLFAYKTNAQELSDTIYTYEGDTIICKISKIEKHWIYYDYTSKKKIKNTYVHISDISSYTYHGAIYKSEERKPTKKYYLEDFKNNTNFYYPYTVPLPKPFIPPTPSFFGH